MPIPQKRIDTYDVDTSVSDDTILIANKNGKTIRQNIQIQICEVNTNSTYKIVYMNQLYDAPNALGVDLKFVKVGAKIPCGVFRNMHICGKCKGRR